MRRILPILFLLAAAGRLQADPQARKYELVGKVTKHQEAPSRSGRSRGAAPVAFLYGATTPYASQTLVGPDGSFKFKNLPPGSYTLTVIVPRSSEVRKTVEISPSFADSKGRVAVSIVFDETTAAKREHAVSTVELSVPKSAMQEYSKAQNALEKPDIERAIAYLKKAVEIAPQFIAAWNNLGTIAYQTQQFALAEQYFREALKHDPESYAPLVNLGGALLSEGKIEESLPINQRAVRARPDDPLAHSQLGQSYYYLENFNEAEKYLKQAKALDPSHFSYPQLLLINIYARRENLPALIAEMEEFLRLHPDARLAPEIRKSLEKARALRP